jgi:hypothetical protein
MKKLILCVLAVTALTVSPAAAFDRDNDSGISTPPTPATQAARAVARLTRRLVLTVAQQATATTLFTAEYTTLATLPASVVTAKAALLAAILVNDPVAIAAAANQLGSLHAQALIAEATASAGLYAILTSTQQAAYAALLMDND